MSASSAYSVYAVAIMGVCSGESGWNHQLVFFQQLPEILH